MRTKCTWPVTALSGVLVAAGAQAGVVSKEPKPCPFGASYVSWKVDWTGPWTFGFFRHLLSAPTNQGQWTRVVIDIPNTGCLEPAAYRRWYLVETCNIICFSDSNMEWVPRQGCGSN